MIGLKVWCMGCIFMSFCPSTSSITIPAGINRMNVIQFTTLSLIGTTIWNFALILLGRLLSDSFDALMNGIHTYSRIMYVIIIIAVIYFVIRYLMKRRRSVK